MTASVALVVAVSATTIAQQQDWPQWRGPLATGIWGGGAVPASWSATENIAWKAPLGGLGVSTPIVIGDRVIVTSQMGAGDRRPGTHPRLIQGADAAAAGERALGSDTPAAAAGEVMFLVEAFSRRDGTRAWQYRLAAEGPLTPVHDKHNLATSSPASDGQRIFAWFGTGQIVALTLDGKLAWQRHLGRDLGPFDIQWGHGSSPVVHGNLLLLLCDQPSVSALLAVDTRSGKEVWRADRGKGRSSYSTPLVVELPGGRAEVIVNSSERLDAYDARTGAHLWFTGDANRFPIPMPVVHEGIIYATRGYRSGPYSAIRPGGRGDITRSHVVWHVDTGAPYVSSVVYAGGLLFMANDAGVITAVDAATGARVWQERTGGVFSASPVAADGRVYFVSESGETIVVRAGREPVILARNDIGERSVASPAIAGGRIFLRTDRHLLAIGQWSGSPIE
jgi:outer membrane protein assembly factor BamB